MWVGNQRPSETKFKTSGLRRLITVAVLMSFAPTVWAAAPTGATLNGAALYDRHCQRCHAGQTVRAPVLDTMRVLPAELVLHAMELGKMKFQGMMRTVREKHALAEFVSQKTLDLSPKKEKTIAGFCTQTPGVFPSPASAAQWNGWGVDAANTRFQPADQAGISAAQVPNLHVKWVFGLPMDYQTSQPTVVGGRVFVGSLRGHVYSIDAKTGCLYWSFAPKAGVRSTIVVGEIPGTDPPRYAAYFGDVEATVYALDARTGRELWQRRIAEHSMARITGTPALYQNRLYIPVTALEEVAGSDPQYECCTFRGEISALDALTGKVIWKTYTIPVPPAKTRKNKVGVQLWGPSGASVWSAPTLDVDKGVFYVGTGDNYSDPPTLNSDAIMAFDMKTGKMLWSRQFTPGDAWNIGCEIEDDANCPKARGPDLDFGSSPILRTLPGGKRVLVAGQKSGVVHAVDPDREGAVLWQERLGKGGLIGGIQWGPAADEDTIYVALSDIGVKTVDDAEAGWSTTLDGSVGGGLFALDLATGTRRWYAPPVGCEGRTQCSPAQSAAVSVIPGIVFSGAVDGHLRAYSTETGEIVWDYNADRDFESTNGVDTKGGAFDGPGPTIVDGMLYVNSGYGFWGALPGNALLAFEVDGQPSSDTH